MSPETQKALDLASSCLHHHPFPRGVQSSWEDMKRQSKAMLPAIKYLLKHRLCLAPQGTKYNLEDSTSIGDIKKK